MASYIRSIDGNHMVRARLCSPVSDADNIKTMQNYSSADDCMVVRLLCLSEMSDTKL